MRSARTPPESYTACKEFYEMHFIIFTVYNSRRISYDSKQEKKTVVYLVSLLKAK